jgi:hypothetical protein
VKLCSQLILKKNVFFSVWKSGTHRRTLLVQSGGPSEVNSLPFHIISYWPSGFGFPHEHEHVEELFL